MDLNFNHKECQVVNFTDVTLFYRLKQEKKTTHQLKTLTASVSHEMIAPLNGTIKMAEMLMIYQTQDRPKNMLNMIINASRLVMCHSNDLLDYNVLDRGTLVENLVMTSIEQAVCEVLAIARFDASKKQSILVDLSKIRGKQAKFDKRRLQQVLLNLSLNAIKFTKKGTIKFEAEILHAQSGSDQSPKI